MLDTWTLESVYKYPTKKEFNLDNYSNHNLQNSSNTSQTLPTLPLPQNGSNTTSPTKEVWRIGSVIICLGNE